MTDRCYVDTCVYVVVLAGGEPGHPDRLEPCTDVLRAAERGQIEMVTSTLTLAEALGTPLTGEHIPADERTRRTKAATDYFASSPEVLIEVDEPLARRAAELAVQYQLKGPDAIHLAAALRAGCRYLYTYDHSLLKIGRIGSLEIAEPATGQQTALA